MKKLKFWNGRALRDDGTLYIAAYTKKQACEMLVDLFGYTYNIWYREMSIYFSECWGDAMDNAMPQVGVWHKKDRWDMPYRVTVATWKL